MFGKPVQRIIQCLENPSKELFNVWKTHPKNYSMFGKPVQRIIQCGFSNNSDIILIYPKLFWELQELHFTKNS